MIDKERELYAIAERKNAQATLFQRVTIVAVIVILAVFSATNVIRNNEADARDKRYQQDRSAQIKAIQSGQERMQSYIRCVALLPQELRTDKALNKCAEDNKIPTISSEDGSTSDSGAVSGVSGSNGSNTLATTQNSSSTPQNGSQSNSGLGQGNGSGNQTPPQNPGLVQNVVQLSKDIVQGTNKFLNNIGK